MKDGQVTEVDEDVVVAHFNEFGFSAIPDLGANQQQLHCRIATRLGVGSYVSFIHNTQQVFLARDFIDDLVAGSLYLGTSRYRKEIA